MPQRDKTGPNGEGPNTGRGEGDCNPKDKRVFKIRLRRNRRQIPRGGRGRNRRK